MTITAAPAPVDDAIRWLSVLRAWLQHVCLIVVIFLLASMTFFALDLAASPTNEEHLAGVRSSAQIVGSCLALVVLGSAFVAMRMATRPPTARERKIALALAAPFLLPLLAPILGIVAFFAL